MSDWKHKKWSDELSFMFFPTSGWVYVSRTPKEAYNPECLVPAVKYKGKPVIIWAAVSWYYSQWPHGLRHGSEATHLLGLWVQIPWGAWISVSCECCVLSHRGLCVGLNTHPEESYRVWCV